jgi:colicin import membrane protein
LGPTGILLGLKDEHVVCYDQATGKELGNYAQVCEQLEQEAAARQAAEQRQREEAAARQVAEQRQREAEQRQREEAAARQAAEQRAQAAEARLRELEEQFQRYNERSS